jgi:hypothetical protein
MSQAKIIIDIGMLASLKPSPRARRGRHIGYSNKLRAKNAPPQVNFWGPQQQQHPKRSFASSYILSAYEYTGSMKTKDIDR